MDHDLMKEAQEDHLNEAAQGPQKEVLDELRQAAKEVATINPSDAIEVPEGLQVDPSLLQPPSKTDSHQMEADIRNLQERIEQLERQD